MKIITSVNFIFSLIFFPVIIGLCKEDPLLIGLSILYCSSATAFLSYGFNKKYIEGQTNGRILSSIANITLFVSILVGLIQYMLEVNMMFRIITTSSILFVGGCVLLFKLIKRESAKQ